MVFTNKRKVLTAVAVSAALLLGPANVALAADTHTRQVSYESVIQETNYGARRIGEAVKTANDLLNTVGEGDVPKGDTTRAVLKSTVARVKPYSKQRERFETTPLNIRATAKAAEGYLEEVDNGLHDLNAAIVGVRQANMSKRLTDAKDGLQTAIDAAQKEYDSSDGQVDTADNRDALGGYLTQARDMLKNGTSPAKITNFVNDTLNPTVEKVKQDVQAHSDRLAAEEAARAAAAAAAASAAASYSYGGGNGYTYGGGSGYSGGYSGYSGYSGGSSVGTGGYSSGDRSAYSSMSCALQSGAWRGGCQGAVDSGGLVHLSQGDLNIYAGHADDGWSWINGLTAGQTVNINGQNYQVTGESIEGAKYAPDSGTWMQTCNGNGNHLVGIRPVG